MNKIATVIITFNRFELFKQVLNAVRNQSRKPDEIIVVNNNSTDGTSEWLKSQNDITVVEQDNVGSSGGQYTGIKTAYDKGYDYIWTMDDDVIPDEKCLEVLEKHIDKGKICVPLRRTKEGDIYYNDTLKINMTNPVKSIWTEVLNNKTPLNDEINAEGVTFEGPIFHRNLVEKIGLPEKKFFIYGDDTEYFVRSLKYGFIQYIIPDAKLFRQIPPPKDLKAFTWKTFYELRNIIAIDVLHGNFLVRLIRPFGYYIERLKHVKSFKEFRTITKALINGYFYSSDN